MFGNIKKEEQVKKLILLAALSVCFSCNVFAQEKDAGKVVAGDQKHRVIRTIFDYQKELGLSDKQVQNLKDKITDLQKYLTEQQKAIIPLQKELNDMISSNAVLKSIREKLDEISRIEVDATVKRIETSRNIEGELTPAQSGKWKAIQLEARKGAQKPPQEAQKEKKEEKAK
jgi:hypothetical protein